MPHPHATKLPLCQVRSEGPKASPERSHHVIMRHGKEIEQIVPGSYNRCAHLHGLKPEESFSQFELISI
ncbi:hypothetical protein DV515_00001649 [Chloebia gouldiae]|uniref:Uncharacterized protein n=1 Tax=Chloebia gouldiae TaxID=44316 RepID=A0A3L8SZR6_CHLGU|nr:hypothetical protein DV515_00001649 [Chloebia gouldiae]